MVELKRFDLRNPDEMAQFNSYFIEYLVEVCDEEEYQENVKDMQDEELNRQMIAQTLSEHNPYYIMKILSDNAYVGFISYSYNESFRRSGTGAKALGLAENHIKSHGGTLMELIPVDGAEGFYLRDGYGASRVNANHETVYAKRI